MIRKEFLIQLDEKKLISEQKLDEQLRIVYSKSIEEGSVCEKITNYNSQGKIELEIERIDGVEITKFIIKYDNNGDILEQLNYAQGDLYEREITNNNQNGYTRITEHDGEEVARIEHQITGKKSFINMFYENGEFVEKHICDYDEERNFCLTKMYDSNNNLLQTREETFDIKDRLINIEEYDENGDLIEEHEYHYQDDLLVKQVENNYSLESYKHITTFYYDENKNQILEETHTSEGQLIEFIKNEYDERNRLILENSSSTNVHHGRYGDTFTNNHYLTIYEYEE